MSLPLLTVSSLRAGTSDKEILKGVDIEIAMGQTVALLGPNGSGKSTLAHVIMGHPDYVVHAGEVRYKNKDLLALKPEERARLGIFLSFQYPHEIAGVSIGNFLRVAYNATHSPLSVGDFLILLKAKMELLHIPHAFMQRSVNEGFSGGEKKRAEMLQLAVLEPDIAILDETDSGLDIDALRTVAAAVHALKAQKPSMAILCITHYQRLLTYLPPDVVAVMKDGHIVHRGSLEVAAAIERDGYSAF